jgi:Ca2+-binding EF-hand superfamily protein
LPQRWAAPALAESEYTLDADENDEITKEEWAGYSESFTDYDADDSGFIDQDEYETWSDEQGFGGTPGGGDDDGPLLGILDTTDDNRVGDDEWFSDEGFSELDDDDSGALEEDEFGA